MPPGWGRGRGLNNGISSVCLLGVYSLEEEDIGYDSLNESPTPTKTPVIPLSVWGRKVTEAHCGKGSRLVEGTEGQPFKVVSCG